MGLFNNIERLIVDVEEAELMNGMGGMGMGGMGMGMGGMGLMGGLAEEPWLMAGQMFDSSCMGKCILILISTTMEPCTTGCGTLWTI